MDFHPRKLQKLEGQEMPPSRLVSDIKPYELMMSPVYVYLSLNGKFVGVKAPLDFFVPEELEKLLSAETLFFTKFLDEVRPFQNAGRIVKNILLLKPKEVKSEREKYPTVNLSVSPYERSDAVLRLIGKLWGSGVRIEPFFVVAFVEELCGAIPIEYLKNTRDKSIELFEKAIFSSSWAVFHALHLGHCSLEFLSRLRIKVFNSISNEEGLVEKRDEVGEIVLFARKLLAKENLRVVDAKEIKSDESRVAQKLSSRLKRVEEQFISEGALAPPSIFGVRGFCNG